SQGVPLPCRTRFKLDASGLSGTDSPPAGRRESEELPFHLEDGAGSPGRLGLGEGLGRFRAGALEAGLVGKLDAKISPENRQIEEVGADAFLDLGIPRLGELSFDRAPGSPEDRQTRLEDASRRTVGNPGCIEESNPVSQGVQLMDPAGHTGPAKL